jgi:general secretion pathway protein L
LSGGQGGDVLAAERARLGDALKILAAVTDATPDDTSLSDLTLHERQVSLTGRSADAARLIGLLAAVPALKDPAFSAPLTRIKDSNIDLFSIKMEARP